MSHFVREDIPVLPLQERVFGGVQVVMDAVKGRSLAMVWVPARKANIMLAGFEYSGSKLKRTKDVANNSYQRKQFKTQTQRMNCCAMGALLYGGS